MSEESKNNKVDLKIFTLVMTLFIAVFGWLFIQINNLNNKVEAYAGKASTIDVQLAQIQVDVQWIKEKLAQSK